VGLYGYFGMGNLGNEGSLAAVLSYLRQAHPSAEVTCYATDAALVSREHGIPARRLMTVPRERRRGRAWDAVVKAACRLRDVPRTFQMMGRVDVLVVPGTGVLERELIERPWGLPYWLLLATASCRLRGRKVALVSVGADPAHDPVIRWMYRWTVRLATYSSFRDESSRQAMREMGVPGAIGPAYPDVAFALPAPPARPPRTGHLVVGVMTYEGKAQAKDRGPHVVETYVRNMTDFLTGALDDGASMTLVVGDVADFPLARRLEADVRTLRPGLPAGTLTVSPARDLAALMEEMTDAEVVVATRFHNVICGLKVARPTVSLGYARKNVDLLSEFGLGDLTQPVDEMDVELLRKHVDAARQRAPELSSSMAAVLRRFRSELDAQLAELSAEVTAAAERRAGRPRRVWRRRAAQRPGRR
jgi:polysaccharide pyruvyl transferase WcaK-like protein